MIENKLTELLIATHNTGKLREFTDLLKALPIELKSLNNFANVIEIAETGSTFAENAELKASGYAKQIDMWTISDDSGLEVGALNGAPGVFSARFAGENATIQQRIEKLLNKLKGSKENDRKARFVCVVSLADPNGEIVQSETAICKGVIAREFRGTNGMGYDSIFIPDGYQQTFGELPDAVKRQISHRALASHKIVEFLRLSDILDI